MKLSENIKNRIKKIITQKHSLKEGVVDYIFGKVLVKKLEKDKDFITMAKKLDSDMQKLKDKVEQMKQNGEKIPAHYKAILNIK